VPKKSAPSRKPASAKPRTVKSAGRSPSAHTPTKTGKPAGKAAKPAKIVSHMAKAAAPAAGESSGKAGTAHPGAKANAAHAPGKSAVVPVKVVAKGPAPKPAVANPGGKAQTAQPGGKSAVTPGGKPAAVVAGKPVVAGGGAGAKGAPAAVDPKKAGVGGGGGGGAGGAPPGRKGITIVTTRPAKVVKPKPSLNSMYLPPGSRLIEPGAPMRKPLIPSGPKAGKGMGGLMAAADGAAKKSPYNKRELLVFRDILRKKRLELVGDVSSMENEALQGQSGSLSHLPQHIADQGSDAYDQSLSLDLAATDRKLIKEIDDALARIEAGTFGLCEITGKPITAERLQELPWTRYSIEAARDLERRSLRP
jgi:RNA polymerase-binding transcription factor DksA